EEMVGRYLVDGRIVFETVRIERKGVIAHAVGERLAIALNLGFGAKGILGDVKTVGDARDRLAVDVNNGIDHLDLVAGKPDHPFDVVGRFVARQLEDDNVAALRQRAPETAEGRKILAEGQRETAVAVGVFRDEEIVADEQRILHRPRGNVEGLEQERPYDQ